MSECIDCTSQPNSKHNNKCICNSENRCNNCPNCKWCIDHKDNGKCVPNSDYNSHKCKNFIEFHKPIYKKNHIGGHFIYKNNQNEFNNFNIINIIIFLFMLLILFIALHYKLN